MLGIAWCAVQQSVGGSGRNSPLAGWSGCDKQIVHTRMEMRASQSKEVKQWLI